MPHSLDVDKLGEVHEVIEENIHRLSKWEKGFIENTKDHWEREGHLSESQLEHLEKIYLRI